MLPYPHIDPVLFSVGPLEVRWYSLAYMAGFIIGAYLFKRANAVFKLLPKGNESAGEDFLTWAVIGVIIGGRLGYVLFYQPDYYMQHPMEAFKIWQGGMAFHGGLAGAGVAAWMYCRLKKIPFIAFCGGMALAAPAGLCFGRLANFINAELYGRVTDSPLGMVFPGGGELPRHPSQLYEAVLEGALLLAVLWLFAFIYAKRNAKKTERPNIRLGGYLTGGFLIGYALARMFIEQFREPDVQLGILSTGLTMGQTLSLPLLAGGMAFIVCGRRYKRSI